MANACASTWRAASIPPPNGRTFASAPRSRGRTLDDSLAADRVGIKDRGRLVPGAYADLVLFDPATVIDRATTSDPHALATGIERVWVNGQPLKSGPT
jgi:hypothetical protein